MTSEARFCRDRVQLAIGLEGWVECSILERVWWAIGALTLGYGRPEPFGLLNLYWKPPTAEGGMGLPWSP